MSESNRNVDNSPAPAAGTASRLPPPPTAPVPPAPQPIGGEWTRSEEAEGRRIEEVGKQVQECEESKRAANG